MLAIMSDALTRMCHQSGGLRLMPRLELRETRTFLLSDTKSQYPFLVNHDMSLDLLQCVFQVLPQREIPFCIVGELALNYYNVPRVVHVGSNSSLCLS